MKKQTKHHNYCPHRAQMVIEKKDNKIRKYLVYWTMMNVHILHFQRCQNNWIWTCSLVINKYKQDNICKTIHRYHTIELRLHSWEYKMRANELNSVIIPHIFLQINFPYCIQDTFCRKNKGPMHLKRTNMDQGELQGPSCQRNNLQNTYRFQKRL